MAGWSIAGEEMIRLGLLALAFLGAAGLGSARAETLQQRGSYLVNSIMTCGNCHTPKGPQGDIAERAFSGGLSWDEPPFKVTAPNITPDKETGIGGWTDAEIKTLLRTGVRPNGVHIAAIMPTGFYGIITERDMDAIVAYLRTLTPIANKVPEPVYRMEVAAQVFPGSERPAKADAMNDKPGRGFYLATIGHCMDCHTPMTKGQHDFVNDAGRGGFELRGPWGVSVSRNITSSKEHGVGAWSDAELKRAITQGISRDGSKLKPPMSYVSYGRMTNDDVDALIAWVRTIPAKD